MRGFFRRGIIRRMLNAGDPAPGFSVKDHTGTTRRLSDYRGKNVVLWFYPKADTPG
jgi:thioredoxin-dependent peroxiredoxin